jgi:microsomal epoxide hydrolase
MIPRRVLPSLLLAALAGARLADAGSLPAAAGPAPGVGAAAPGADRFFTSSDGVRLHYLEAGGGPTIVFVPGWTMPAWIWAPQIAYFAGRYRVIAFDPRAQGDSAIAPSGYDPVRKGQDIAELLEALGPGPVVLVGWSLGVLDSLAYVHAHGDRRLAGLVLVDNSVGEDPPPAPAERAPAPRARRTGGVSRDAAMRRFVTGMFRRPQPPDYLDRLTAACLRTPPSVAAALLAIPQPRGFWKEAIYSTNRPVLYAVTPRFAGQAINLANHHPSAEAVRLNDVGHAMFVDDSARFNALMQDFIRRRVWP